MSAVKRGGTGHAGAAARAGIHRAAGNPAAVPVPACLGDHRALASRLALPHLEMKALPGAVPRARHRARQMLWDAGLKELIEAVELVVSELVTNAVRACEGLAVTGETEAAEPVIRLWVSVESDAALVLVWDASSSMPRRQEPAPDAESGRGLLLVETLTVAWGAFELSGEPGKVVWALCQS